MKVMTTPSLKQIIEPVSADIARIDEILREVAALEHPILQQAVEAIIAAGGKRLRPAVLFLSAGFYNCDRDRLIPLAAAIELLHTASLVHDDTIDRSLMRRGLPTLNSFVDAGTTVLVGDYLFAKSAVLSTMGGKMRATRIFAEALVTIVGGEIAQKLSAHNSLTSMDEYLSRIYSKTASLFAASGEIGAVLSDAPEDEVQRLRHYSRQIGMAFQIVDDILDFQATAQELGKPTGGDLRGGTVTLPTLLYLEGASEPERSRLRQVVEADPPDESLTAEVVESILRSDAIGKAGDVAARYSEEAKAALSGFPDVSARRSLSDLADFVVHRTF